MNVRNLIDAAMAVDDLSDLKDEKNPIAEQKTDIASLLRHGSTGRAKVVLITRLGFPCGSGAIESGRLRMIDLSLKS